MSVALKNEILGFPQPQQNHLLAMLPADARQRLFPQLQLVYLPAGRVLFDPGREMRFAYFPIDSVVAVVGLLEGGSSAEVVLVGNEGVVGLACFMGGESTPLRVVVKFGGHAFRVAKSLIHVEFERHSEALLVLLAYVQSIVNRLGRAAMCNRLHSVEQRLCRWLLECLDRVPGARLQITHGEIAEMLGVRRESISAAAGDLRALGAIEYHRGAVTVLDRRTLESLVCECYQCAGVHRSGLAEARVAA